MVITLCISPWSDHDHAQCTNRTFQPCEFYSTYHGEAESRMETGNSVTRHRAKKQFDDSTLLFKKLEEDQQKVFNVVILFNVIGSSQEVLDIRVRNLTQKLSGVGMRGRTAISNQEEGFLSSGPWG